MPIKDLFAPAAYAALTGSVKPDGECVTWAAATSAAGYGRLVFRGRMMYAHRLSYLLAKGPIPEGLEIDHLCRNRACVNPHHLEAVTHHENMLRGSRATATECQRGHVFDEANTLTIRPKGGEPYRACRACRNLRAQEARRRAKEAGS